MSHPDSTKEYHEHNEHSAKDKALRRHIEKSDKHKKSKGLAKYKKGRGIVGAGGGTRASFNKKSGLIEFN